jgi:hypothetical protein
MTIAVPVRAAIHYVPDNFTNIQSAIDAANPGDTIVVRDGTWTGEFNRNLDFLGKDLILQSENGAAACIIDAEGNSSSTQRGFWFHGDETRSAVVDGFTITGGFALDWITPDNDGAGILIENGSKPTIQNCIIEGNTARYGAGIMVRQSNPRIYNSIVRDNATESGGMGGGVYLLSSQGVVDGCEIRGNQANSGGGLFVSSGPPLILNCQIIANTATGDGGGISWNALTGDVRFCTISKNVATNGGGIQNKSSGLAIYKCTISGNRATELGRGGGISFYDTSSSNATYCILWGNVDAGNPNGNQIAITSMGSATAFIDHSLVEGGAADIYVDPNGTLNWGTFNSSENPQFCASDPDGEESWVLQSDSPCFTHVWGQIGAWSSGCDITPTLLQDFTARPTPAGVDLTWSLSEADQWQFRLVGRREGHSWPVEYSIGAAARYRALDACAESRRPGEIVYELSYRLAGEPWAELASQTASIPTPALNARSLEAHPNPFNPQLDLAFATERRERVTVTIFDARGRRVVVLADRIFDAGEHSLRWDGRGTAGEAVASGSYVVQLTTERRVLSRKVVLVR